jgi:hypothetical protein
MGNRGRTKTIEFPQEIKVMGRWKFKIGSCREDVKSLKRMENLSKLLSLQGT